MLVLISRECFALLRIDGSFARPRCQLHNTVSGHMLFLIRGLVVTGLVAYFRIRTTDRWKAPIVVGRGMAYSRGNRS